MRIVGILFSQSHARKFAQFLRKQGIENTCEISFDREQGQIRCSIWVHEEDHVAKAAEYFKDFQNNPEDPKYDVSLAETLKAEGDINAIENPSRIKIDQEEKKPSFALTYFFLIICALVFFLNTLQEISFSKKNPLTAPYMVTPIQNALLYDSPTAILALNKILESYPYDAAHPPQEIPPDLRAKLLDLEKLPYFRGAYDLILAKASGHPEDRPSGPMFVKIRKGQVWRLFTPAILHKDLLHILFNMLWLWVLGKQMELRLPRFRFLLMILITAIISNTAQYLMSGPYFLGFSGIVVGMAAFIWVRQKVAPWEGYPLHRTTLLFLGLFVGSMFLLQFSSFLIQLFGWGTFSPNIANTAHIVGGLVGALLGRMPYFSWRPRER